MSWIKAVGRSKAAPKETVPPLHLRLSDWTGHFRDGNKFAEGLLDQLTLPGEMTAVAYEPGMGYLAVGTYTRSPRHIGGQCPPVWCAKCASVVHATSGPQSKTPAVQVGHVSADLYRYVAGSHQMRKTT